jgi:hypothetical protein
MLGIGDGNKRGARMMVDQEIKRIVRPATRHGSIIICQGSNSIKGRVYHMIQPAISSVGAEAK